MPIIVDALVHLLTKKKSEHIFPEIDSLVEELGWPADRVHLHAAAMALKRTDCLSARESHAT